MSRLPPSRPAPRPVRDGCLVLIVYPLPLVAGIITLLKWAAVEDSEAQALDRVASELRQLVEEQDAVMRQCS
jgi:hypothetical protein